MLIFRSGKQFEKNYQARTVLNEPYQNNEGAAVILPTPRECPKGAAVMITFTPMTIKKVWLIIPSSLRNGKPSVSVHHSVDPG
jgi:hypothetical protein